jgi:hypothetical protein
VEVAQAGAAESESSFEVADAGFDTDAPVAHSPEGSGVFVFSPGVAEGAAALQADMSDAEGGQGLVVGGGAEAAVADHGGRGASGGLDDLFNGRDQLTGVAGVALVDLVERDEAALVFGDQGGVAELGGVLGFALADRAGGSAAAGLVLLCRAVMDAMSDDTVSGWIGSPQAVVKTWPFSLFSAPFHASPAARRSAFCRFRWFLRTWTVSASMLTTRDRPLFVVPSMRSPATNAAEPAMVICLPSRSTSHHRRLSSSPRRAPVYAAMWKKADRRCALATLRKVRSCAASQTLPGPGRCVLGRFARSTGLDDSDRRGADAEQ